MQLARETRNEPKHQHGQTRHTEVSKWRFLVGKLACWVLLSANVCKTQLQLLLRKTFFHQLMATVRPLPKVCPGGLSSLGGHMASWVPFRCCASSASGPGLETFFYGFS